jgi:hypothetical protein
VFVPAEHLIADAGLAPTVQEGLVKGEIQFKNPKVLEVVHDAVDGEHLLNVRLSAHLLAPAGETMAIAFFRVYLPDPSGITVGGCP